MNDGRLTLTRHDVQRMLRRAEAAEKAAKAARRRAAELAERTAEIRRRTSGLRSCHPGDR